MIIVFNKHIFFGKQSRIVEIVLLLLSFIVLAMLASELENIFRYLIRNSTSYSPFSNLESSPGQFRNHRGAGICILLPAMAEYLNPERIPKNHFLPVNTPPASTEYPSGTTGKPSWWNWTRVLYIEAYDNYSLVFCTNGEKLLCNYSLGYLEPVLDHAFIRIHRKHMVNKQKIRSLAKHTHNRYIVRLNDEDTELVSSAGYSKRSGNW